MDERYTATLADGTVLRSLRKLSTGQFITIAPIDNELLSPTNLSKVVIENQYGKEILHNQVCDGVCEIDHMFAFILRDMTELEKIQADYKSKLDYLSALFGVDFDE